MLRLLGFLTLGNMIFGRRHRRHRRGLLLGALIGLFAARAYTARSRADEGEAYNE